VRERKKEEEEEEEGGVKGGASSLSVLRSELDMKRLISVEELLQLIHRW